MKFLSNIPFEGHVLGNQYVAVLDCETTGFDPVGCDPIAWSVIITGQDLQIIDQREFYARPLSKRYWSEDAVKIHGITWDRAARFPHQRETCIEMLNFLVPYKHPENLPILFVFHAKNNFDWKFAEWMFRKQELQYSFWRVFHHGYRLSTISFAEQMGYTGNGLAEWARRLGMTASHQHHDAKSDSVMCLEVLKHLCSLSQQPTLQPGPTTPAETVKKKSRRKATSNASSFETATSLRL